MSAKRKTRRLAGLVVRFPDCLPGCWLEVKSVCTLLISPNIWRRGRDSNPRYGCPYAAFRVRRDRPLCHLSKPSRLSGKPGEAPLWSLWWNGEAPLDNRTQPRWQASKPPPAGRSAKPEGSRPRRLISGAFTRSGRATMPPTACAGRSAIPPRLRHRSRLRGINPRAIPRGVSDETLTSGSKLRSKAVSNSGSDPELPR